MTRSGPFVPVGMNFGCDVIAEYFGVVRPKLFEENHMTTPRIPKHSTANILIGRFGPLIMLAGLTTLAAMFVISSLHGCRRNHDVKISNEPRSQQSIESSSTATSPSPNSSTTEYRLESVPLSPIPPRSLDDSTPNPAEADAFLREEMTSHHQIPSSPIGEGDMTPLRPVASTPSTADEIAKVSVQINQVMAAKNVAKRRPVGQGNQFEANGDSVWAWASVRNVSEASSHVWMIWRHEGMVRSRVRLKVGQSPRWRTWSRFRMRASHIGHWSVDTTDADGMVLDTLEFDVVPAEATTTAFSAKTGITD